ncbi:ATP-binding cassette domain-containing protein, partial [Aerococcus sp. JJEM-2022a]|uniref:ATP-binding cassette domain-containing protein n=1 Tax=Aerococcus loyolae TaxID=2976809 RepID=UPI0022785CA6
MKAIELINVSKFFQDGDQTIEALKPTNFSVNDGEFVAIVGPSGSGKSTFLTLSGGLQSPSQGEVRVKGQAFSSLKEKDRAKRRFQEIGFILQASNLIPYLTVKDQLRLVDKIQGHSQAAYAQDLFQELGVDRVWDKSLRTIKKRESTNYLSVICRFSYFLAFILLYFFKLLAMKANPT